MKFYFFFIFFICVFNSYGAKPFNRKGIPVFKGYRSDKVEAPKKKIACNPNSIVNELTMRGAKLPHPISSSPLIEIAIDLERFFIEKSILPGQTSETLSILRQRLQNGIESIEKHLLQEENGIYDFIKLKKLMLENLKKLDEDYLHLGKRAHKELNDRTLALTLEKYFGPFKSYLIELKYMALEDNVIGSNILLNQLIKKLSSESSDLQNMRQGLEIVYDKLKSEFELDQKLLKNLKGLYEIQAGNAKIPLLNIKDSKDFLDTILIKEIDILTLDKKLNTETWVEVKNVKDIQVDSIKYQRVIEQARKTVFVTQSILEGFGYPRHIQHKMIMNYPVPKKLKRELEWIGYEVTAPRFY